MKRAIPLLLTAMTFFSLAATAQEGPLTGEAAVRNLYEIIDRISEDIDKEIIVDPRLNETRVIPEEGVFDQAPRPQAYTTERAPDYESLLGMLRTIDFVAIETADQILVMPEQTARALPSRVLQEDDPSVSDHEIVTRIIHVPLEVAPTLVPILRPMIPQAGQFGAVPNYGGLIIVDRYDNVRRITAIIEEIIDGLEN